MHKNTYAKVSTLSVIAISAILLTSFTMIGMLYSPHAMAQTNSTSGPPSTSSSSAAPSDNSSSAASSGNSSSAASSGNSSSSSAGSSANATSTQEPAIGQSFVWQGTKSSQADPLSGHGKEQVAAVLIPRTDGGVYSGVLTFTASKSPTVEVWHNFDAGNTSDIPTKSFGTMKLSDYQGKKYALTDISGSGGSGSVPFSGNAVLLHAGSPFTVTYTVNAVAQPSKVVNNVQSAMALATPPTPKVLSGGSSNSSSSSSGGSSSGSSGGSSSGSSGGSSSGSSGEKMSKSSSSSDKGKSSSPSMPIEPLH